jgi:DNA-binding response OmpR family regulator
MIQRTCLILATEGPSCAIGDLLTTWSVRVIEDPGTFLDRLTAERPDVAVISSPPATVGDLACVERERRRRPDLVAVLLDPAERVSERLDALEWGFDDALPTSITADELAGRLVRLADRVLNRRRQVRRVSITPTFDLDLMGRMLLQNGRPIALRPKEFALLSELARQPGVVCERTALVERLWGPRAAVGSGTLNVHVRRLRMKIEPSPDRPAHLVTIRGVGYRLDRVPV